MRACWLVRAGEGSRHAETFAKRSVIAVGWNDISGLNDVRDLSESDIAALIRAKGRTASVATSESIELTNFCDGIHLGDVVITPDAPARELLVGEVTGGYEYRETDPIGDYKHVRTVEWYGRRTRDGLPKQLDQETRYRHTILALEQTADAWRAIADTMKAGDCVPALQRRGTRGSASTARNVRRPPQPVAAERRCPSCGLAKATTQFAPDDSACVDCRS